MPHVIAFVPAGSYSEAVEIFATKYGIPPYFVAISPGGFVAYISKLAFQLSQGAAHND